MGTAAFTKMEELSEEQLLRMLDPARIPGHIAVIMDGNRRWAKQRRLPALLGHRAGVEAFRKVVETCVEIGVKVLTTYAFSKENWSRSRSEVDLLLNMFEYYSKQERENLKKNGVKFRVVGMVEKLPPRLREEFFKTEEYTKDGDKLILNLAVNYGARAEILQAAIRLAEDLKNGKLTPEEVTEEIFSGYFYTAGLPDPDLLIRTSGELRISNFLLWQIAYTELWFTPRYWPDFGRRELLLALKDYQSRERRFGGTGN